MHFWEFQTYRILCNFSSFKLFGVSANFNNIDKNESYDPSNTDIECKTESISNLNMNSLDYTTDLTTFDSKFEISNAFLYPFDWLSIADLDDDDDYNYILHLRLQIISLIVNYYNIRKDITYDH